MSDILTKEKRLIVILETMPDCIISYSGGLDSSYLCSMAARHAPDRVLCVTISDPSTPSGDLEFAGTFAKEQNLEHQIVQRDIPDEVRRNTAERCYLCKKDIIRILNDIASKEEFRVILDGQNASDASEERPGRRAATEAGVRSPLAEAGLTKEDITILAGKMRISQAVRPASACLATRIPTDIELLDRDMRKIDLTERLLRSKGLKMVRARLNGDRIRIELGRDEKTPENHRLLEELEGEIKEIGWTAVEIDPAGYIPPGERRKGS